MKFGKKSMHDLENACLLNDLDRVKQLLEQGVNYNINFTMSYAIIHNNIEMVKLFLSYGMDPNFDNGLYNSCATENIEVIKLLLECGADPFKVEDFQQMIIVLWVLIKNNIVTEEWVAENTHRIPEELWRVLYG
jgi:ankyrin repeat protein